MTDEKPIRLRVVSVMTDPDGGRHESKTVHRGTLRAGEDGLEIAYEQVDEGVRAHICLTWTADGVRMRRTGEMTGALHFQPGRKTAGLYGTAEAALLIWVIGLMILSIKEMNGYSVRKTLLIVLLSVFTMLIIWATVVLLFTISSQFVTMLREVYFEMIYRIG